MLIRKATGEEMLKLWGYQDENTASPTAKFFYRNISSGNAIFWTLDNGGELIGELYVFWIWRTRILQMGKTPPIYARFA